MNARFPSFPVWLLVVALPWFPARAQTEVRPLVQVNFRLLEPTYRAQFRSDVEPGPGTSEIRRFEDATSRALESVLSRRISFLRFGPGTNAHQLQVTLEREPVADPRTQLVPTRLLVSLTSVPEPRPSLIWEFRPPQEFISPVAPDNFLVEITNRVAFRLESSLAPTVATLFSRISLGRDVYLLVLPDAVVFLLPFSYEEIGLGRYSGLEFATVKKEPIRRDFRHGVRALEPGDTPVADVPAPFARGIPAIEDDRSVLGPLKHTPWNRQAGTNGLVRGEGLFVTEYVPLPAGSLGANTPSDFRLP